ncbi:uncharacterized protein LOC134206371 [Armigeres subalbatus]|uniref:uncharacterized protein LOC134206371 n=1 Tax=Armigeres subalbatus TaxID=124917 RepID=UPI002ED2F5AA
MTRRQGTESFTNGCNSSSHWRSEPIAGEVLPKWRYWCLYMQRLGEVTVPRCFFKGMNSYALEDVEAHLFVDASEAACSAVLYLRCVQNGVTKCATIASKTKVAPLKPISVPRLELQAAMIGTRMMDSVWRSLDIHVSRRYLWSDSSTMLCWLRSDSRWYHQFVAVRVGEILTLTSADEWHYMPSKINIADEATKWKESPICDPNDSWFTAPEFLRKSRDEWPAQNGSESETELRSVFLYHGTVPQPLLDFNRFSNWLRLVRTATYMLRAVRRFRGEKFLRPKVLTKEELFEAENMIWRQVQNEAYPDEYARNLTQLSNPVSIPKSSPLYRLSAFVDEFCVVRMNSRLSAEQTLSYGLRHPILFPRLHPAVHLLAEYYHRRYLHGNAETICNEMRQNFFIPGLRILIRQVSKQCLTCRIKKSVPQPPMMAPLPQALTQTRPFSHTGVDYFGPIMVKQGRSLVKRWVALFTCLTVLAVHLEIVHSLSTQSCIMAIRRFVARLGAPEAFYSDNDTNFIGASNLLVMQIQNIQEDCAITFTNSNTSWNFNPPAASHMGGSWERMARSIKTVMQAISDHPHHPSDEILETMALEAESIVNSRPLTHIPLDSSKRSPSRQTTSYSLEIFTGTADGVQCLVNLFWSRWVREYLSIITRRTKWLEPVKPLEPGDIVLIVDEGKRNGWIRGRVAEFTKAADGQVQRAVVRTKNGLVVRPAVKLALLDLRTSRRSGTTREGEPLNTTECVRYRP